MAQQRDETRRTKPVKAGYWMSEDDKAALYALAAHHGISMGDVVAMLVRRETRKEQITVKPLDHYI